MMRQTIDIWQLSRSEELSTWFADHRDLDAWITGCVESYQICRQRNHGDLRIKTLPELLFQDVHDHIYLEQGGCGWCRRRVQSKIRAWLSRKEGIDQDEQKGQTLVVSLS